MREAEKKTRRVLSTVGLESVRVACERSAAERELCSGGGGGGGLHERQVEPAQVEHEHAAVRGARRDAVAPVVPAHLPMLWREATSTDRKCKQHTEHTVRMCVYSMCFK